MPKFTVRAVQVITQRVTFEVEAESAAAAAARVRFGGGEPTESMELVDAEDEEYLQTIVCEVKELKE